MSEAIELLLKKITIKSTSIEVLEITQAILNLKNSMK